MLKNYIKMALKVLMRRKFFTFISLFAISFTLLILMMATTFLDHSYGPFPPETRMDRTLGIFSAMMTGGNNTSSGPSGVGFIEQYIRPLPMIENVTVFNSQYGKQVTAYWKGQKIELKMKLTDAEYWRILDFEFLEGGPYTTQDVDEKNFVAVITQATRAKFFGDEPGVGRTIPVDGLRFRVIGVVKNVPAFRDVVYGDMWVPISAQRGDGYKTSLMGGYQAFILAKSRDDFPLIKSAVQDVLPQVEITQENMDTYYTAAETYFEASARTIISQRDFSQSYSSELFLIIALIMVLFMLLPTINLINLNVSRIMERASEIGVRKAFGASSWTLVGQFVTENVILTLVGGVIGAVLTMTAFAILSNSGFIAHAEFHINFRVFLYGLIVILFFGVFSGVYPAWRMSRLHPVEALRGGER